MVAGPALRGAASLQRCRFLPSARGALARVPWDRLLDAAHEAKREFGNINSTAFERSYDDLAAAHGLGSLGEEAVAEVHEKGAVLLRPSDSQVARLLADVVDRPAPNFPWESARTANSVADFLFTLLPVVFGRRLYMSHAGDHGNNLMNIMPMPDVSTVNPNGELPDRIKELISESRGRKLLDGLVRSSHSLLHPWHTDVGHAQRMPEMTALLSVRNPTAVPTYIAPLAEVLARLDEVDIRVLEEEPVLNACLCANRNIVSMATVSHDRSRTRFAASRQWHIGAESPALASALARFEAAADAVGVGVAMEAGDILVLTNDTALHGRYPLEPQPVPPPTDRTRIRWNKLLYMARPEDVPTYEAARWKGRRFIVDKRAFFDWDRVVGNASELAQCQHGTGFARLKLAAGCWMKGAVSKAKADRERFAHLYHGAGAASR